MTRKKSHRRAPALVHHKPTGQARVRLNGRDHYCGKFGTPEAYERYVELVRQWEDGNRRPVEPTTRRRSHGVTIAALVQEYLADIDAKGRYRRDGVKTTQRDLIETALDELVDFAGSVCVGQLCEELLVQHRDRLERKPRLTRRGINRKMALIRQCLRWGRRRGLVSKAVWVDVSALEPLTRQEAAGRREPPRKEPVTEELLCLALPHCPPPVAAMLRIQWLTGMRPGEVRTMRWEDIETTPLIHEGVSCWTYHVAQGKTAHHGHETVYALNPACQEILREFQGRDHGYVFAPARAGTADHYGKDQYRTAIRRACREAGVPAFSPHQVRHAFVTWAANDPSLGSGAAGAAVNHRCRSTTDRYAHLDRSLALKVAAAADRARRVG